MEKRYRNKIIIIIIIITVPVYLLGGPSHQYSASVSAGYVRFLSSIQRQCI